MSELKVKFKDGIDPTQFQFLHPDIKHVFEFLAFILDRMGCDVVITSMIRPHKLDSGIHATGRGLDCVPIPRPKYVHKYLNGDFLRVAAFLGFIFRRPSNFPIAIYHDAGSGIHFHLQVDKKYQWNDELSKEWVDYEGVPTTVNYSIFSIQP